MKRLAFLRILINILFLVCMLIVFFGLPLILIITFSPRSVPFNVNGHAIEASSFELFFLMLVLYLGHCAFTYAIYLFGKTLALFAKKIIFDDKVIAMLDQAGKSFIVAGMLWIIPPFFYRLLAENTLEARLDFTGFGSTIFAISLGLFLMVLSEVFLMAKNIKEENDLTV